MNKIFNLFHSFAKKREILERSFLVGGSVRDIVMNLKINDYDITINGDTINIIKAFSDEISASFILLDERFGIVRVAKEGEFIDFSTMKGNAIEADLSMRDFTINAMAINLSEFKDFLDKIGSLNSNLKDIQNFIIDPFNGLLDLKSKIIRMLSENNLLQDPLRLLRAFRFCSTLGFSIEMNTYNATCKLAPHISKVAVERITEELRHILMVDFSYKTIRDMYESGLLINLFPELKNINHDTIDHNICSYSFAEYILNNLSLYFPDHKIIADYFTENYRIVCLKLAILLSSGKLPITIAERLKMSKREIQLIQMIIELHKDFVEHENADWAEKIDFLRLFGHVIYPLVIYTMANEHICYDNEDPTLLYCKEMLEIYHKEVIPKKKLLPIITGEDLISEFKLSPSPLFKTLLNEIEALFLEGRISNRNEALETVRRLIKRGIIL